MIQTAIRDRTQDWAEEESSRICSIVLSSNLGILDQIINNQTELLDLLTIQQLSSPDDIGVTPIYQAVYYDRPIIVQYLHNRGVDISKPCDPAYYGNAMFYAVSMKKYAIVELLDRLDYSVNQPCDSFQQLPIAHAQRLDDPIMICIIQHCSNRRFRIAEMFRRNYLRCKYHRRYQRMRAAVKVIQRFVRITLSKHTSTSCTEY